MDLSAVSLIKVTINTVKEENIEDRDEYLNIRETVSHVNINRKPNWIDRASKIPKYVATPLPPLNFSQTGKMWPKKARRQDNWISPGKCCCTIITGIYPFKISNINVSAAKNLLPVLSTFVAPIFPEPIFLISWSPKILVKINPKGIEPLK